MAVPVVTENRRGTGLQRRRKGLSQPLPTSPVIQETNFEWNEAIDKYLTWERSTGLAPRTVQLHRENMDATVKLFSKLGFTVKPTDVTPYHLQQVIVDMLNEGREHRTVNIRIDTWRKFFTWLRDHERARPDNPAESIQKLRETRKLIPSLDERQVIRLLSVFDVTRFAEFRDYVMTVLMLDTGMRCSEASFLLLDDINLKGYSIYIHSSGLNHTTKDHEERTVYLTKRTVGLLERWIELRGDGLGHRYCFVRNDGLPLDHNTYRYNLTHVYGPRANLHVTPHMLRHTFARMFITAGGDPFTLQKLLGHSTLEMVRRYVELWGTDVQRIHARFSPVERLGL